jgi:hypothetical protein
VPDAPSTPDAYQEAAFKRLGTAIRRGASAQTDGTPEAQQMKANRRVSMRKQGAATPTTAFATGRPRDPLFYWKQNNLPYEVDDEAQLRQLRMYCRLLYQTHPVIASCIDIYTKYPLLGMELRCKDEQVQQFYEDLFFTEDGLNYDEFLLDVGREYWTVGEAWPFATFNESLGIWDDEELLNPDDVMVQRSAFLKEPRFLIRLPETIREVMQKRAPAWEYEKLMQVYPELAQYAGNDDMMPVSNILLRQMKFKADTFSKRGIPILMRAMRAVMQEEMLNAAQDAIADRLYTPLVLVKLGASATDLGTQVPWIPTPDDLEEFMESLDAALAADFRALVHNFAVTMEPVFGRENMPDMTADFERLEDRILQSFGLSKTMLSGASSGETYAADALNRDLVSQLLTTYQDMIKRHFHQRALVVAEAQEHYDYDERNGKRYVKMEEILEIDEETGEERIVEQPKLLVPELVMQTMSLSDESAEREFFEALRQAGVPISMKTRLMASGIDLDDEIERTQDEAVALAVAEQETRKKTFQALKDAGLPIPSDLRADFQPVAQQAMPPALPDATQGIQTPQMGMTPGTPTPTLAPTQMDMMSNEPAGGVAMPGMPATPVDGSETGGDAPAEGDQRPDESDEMRAGMPKPAALFRQTERTRTAARKHYQEPKRPDDVPLRDQDPMGKFSTPKVVGVRRHIEVDPATFFEEETARA